MTRSLVAGVLLAGIVLGCDQMLQTQPQTSDLIGQYRLAKESEQFLITQKHYPVVPSSVVELKDDGTISITALADCANDGFGESKGGFLSGRGRWELKKGFVGWGLDLRIHEGGTLPAGVYSGPWVALRRRSAPHELEFTVGDPDSGETLRYVRDSS